LNAGSWAFGGAPYGATKRVRGVPKWLTGWRTQARIGRGRGGGEESWRRERGALSLQNEDPTPQNGWEQLLKTDPPSIREAVENA
jgi:hypothetical protein